MTRAQALAELIAKVEAGDATNFSSAFVYCDRLGMDYHGAWAEKAYHGSLDAALALHQAVLPRWDWCLTPDGASVYSSHDNSPTDADLSCAPARAWLLAILKALHA